MAVVAVTLGTFENLKKGAESLESLESCSYQINLFRLVLLLLLLLLLLRLFLPLLLFLFLFLFSNCW